MAIKEKDTCPERGGIYFFCLFNLSDFLGRDMDMQFRILGVQQRVPNSGRNTVYLQVDRWNDYSFVTMFYLSLHDESGNYHEFGNVKIGFKGQDTSRSTYSTLNEVFTSLPIGYFSLGTDLDYYKKIKSSLTDRDIAALLSSLKDIVFDESNLVSALDEDVFSTSLLRGVSLYTAKIQFKRVLQGGVPLTDFKFSYKRSREERFSGVDLSFQVTPESMPSTNIHAITGRNGSGKTTILNGMIKSLTDNSGEHGGFFSNEFLGEGPIDPEYFSSLVSVSFSAFDPFIPPREQSNPALGACYYYIGLKDNSDDSGLRLKSLHDLRVEFSEGISLCMMDKGKKNRWLMAIRTLESDDNFLDMNIAALAVFSGDDLKHNAYSLMERMSSGHAVVLLTITKLVATVEEKTLVLIDEPESHLHPPLLSAFIRALSELLYDRNGVAIIATHSPVVLQEIPASCVWKITRLRLALSSARPEIQTFGENVGILTRDVFGLEVIKSGFHQLLKESVENGGNFEEVMAEYNGQLGFEAQAILRVLIFYRDRERTL
jgi:predicted ATPase